MMSQPRRSKSQPLPAEKQLNAEFQLAASSSFSDDPDGRVAAAALAGRKRGWQPPSLQRSLDSISNDLHRLLSRHSRLRPIMDRLNCADSGSLNCWLRNRLASVWPTESDSGAEGPTAAKIRRTDIQIGGPGPVNDEFVPVNTGCDDDSSQAVQEDDNCDFDPAFAAASVRPRRIRYDFNASLLEFEDSLSQPIESGTKDNYNEGRSILSCFSDEEDEQNDDADCPSESIKAERPPVPTLTGSGVSSDRRILANIVFSHRVASYYKPNLPAIVECDEEQLAASGPLPSAADAAKIEQPEEAAEDDSESRRSTPSPRTLRRESDWSSMLPPLSPESEMRQLKAEFFLLLANSEAYERLLEINSHWRLRWEP